MSNIIDNSYVDIILLRKRFTFNDTALLYVQNLSNIYLPLHMLCFSFISVPESVIHESFVCRSGTVISGELLFPTVITVNKQLTEPLGIQYKRC